MVDRRLEPVRAKVTQRLAESVEQLCEAMAARHAARYFDLDWKTVKRLDRQRLERTLGPVDLDGIEVIAMDEFAIQKATATPSSAPTPRSSSTCPTSSPSTAAW